MGTAHQTEHYRVPVGHADATRMLKNRLLSTNGGNAGDRVISEARRLWSHLLLSRSRKTFPNTVASLDDGPEHHELIHGATTPWRGGLADEITRSRTIASAGAESFSVLPEIGNNETPPY